MKRTILVILAVIVAALTATQAHAQDSPIVGVGETIAAQVQDNLLVRYESLGAGWGEPRNPAYTIENGSVVVTYTFNSRAPLNYEIRWGGGKVTGAEIDGPRTYTNYYGTLLAAFEGTGHKKYYQTTTLTLTFGLGPMVVELSDTPQTQPCVHRAGDCPIRTSPGTQMVGPGALGDDLYGCRAVKKQCYFEGAEEHCPLVCVQPGWTGPQPRHPLE